MSIQSVSERFLHSIIVISGVSWYSMIDSCVSGSMEHTPDMPGPSSSSRAWAALCLPLHPARVSPPVAHAGSTFRLHRNAIVAFALVLTNMCIQELILPRDITQSRREDALKRYLYSVIDNHTGAAEPLPGVCPTAAVGPLTGGDGLKARPLAPLPTPSCAWSCRAAGHHRVGWAAGVAGHARGARTGPPPTAPTGHHTGSCVLGRMG